MATKATGVGRAMFAHMKQTEKINGKDMGKYTIMLALDEAGRNALLADIKQAWAAFCATPEMKGKPVSQNWNTGFRTYKDTVYAKFSASAKINTRSGEVINVSIPVFDGAGNPLNLQKEIGNGSVVKVAYDLYPYYMSQQTHGVSLRLKAVQVLDLKTYAGGSASSFGFDTTGPAINPNAIEAINNAPEEAPSDEIPFAEDNGYYEEPVPFDNNGDF